MKRTIIATVIISAIFFFLQFTFIALAAPLNVKLPYSKGQSFVVVQGYDTLPTHIKKDRYALDLSQNGCQAYGKPVVAAAAGTAMVVQEEGYNGGYGAEVIVNHGDNIVSRYAHMLPGSIEIGVNMPIEQGQIIGSVGNTGLVAGFACPTHPGTHLHFAMDIRTDDGALDAYDPEPISGYRNIIAGRWYLSDNDGSHPIAMIAPPDVDAGKVLGAATSTVLTTTATATAAVMPAPPSIPIVISYASPIIPLGGVVVLPAEPTPSTPAISPITTSTPIIITAPTSTPPSASTSSSVSASTTVSISSSTIFKQSDDSVNSPFSWYDDNWFDLGSGFSGTLNSLTLEAMISNSVFFSSHVELQEFKDANYTAMIKQFTISDDAPFTGKMATTTFTALSIPLKPYFYYRLATIQDYQNRSVIFAGTSSTGTQMWDNFVYGVGRVESTSTFMPYIEMDGIVATSTFTPPLLTLPTNITPAFNELGMSLGVSFTTSTDPEWPENPLYYEINFSTSSVFDDTAWKSDAYATVVLGDQYLIGVRALDNFGDVSGVATATWNFPPGFVPYKLSTWTNYVSQDFQLPTDGTLDAIELFTTNFGTGSRNPDSNDCVLSLFDLGTSSLGSPILSNSGYNGYRCAGDLTFSFASSSFVLAANHQYRWTFQLHDGGPSAQGGVQFYGTASDTAHGVFSDPAIVNAKFKIIGTSGTLFAN